MLVYLPKKKKGKIGSFPVLGMWAWVLSHGQRKSELNIGFSSIMLTVNILKQIVADV